MSKQAKTVDAYIDSFPSPVRVMLVQIRTLIKNEAPEAIESISYGMPAYKTHGKPLVYFAAFSNHIGFYATPTGHAAFEKELSAYKQGKGSVQFPLDKPLPLQLVKKIVAFRLKENAQNTKQKHSTNHKP